MWMEEINLFIVKAEELTGNKVTLDSPKDAIKVCNDIYFLDSIMLTKIKNAVGSAFLFC
jgi:benzoyl-CoA reductase/2-hydroxyglutaryl-CoA dehydratase subunit BcrC/BadD/HgdB